MAITISTHNGSKVDLAHNRREAWRINQENVKWREKYPGELRIDLNKQHEILIDNGSLKNCYEKLFGESLKEWNERQIAKGNNDRVIKNYLQKIKADENKSPTSKHPIYEIIHSIGSKEKPIPSEIAERILKEAVGGFQERNPNLFVVSQVLHADEAGVIHTHTSYIPVATNMSRGMHTQNALKEALKQQGIEGNRKETAQMKFQRRENEILEKACNKYGYDVEHPQKGTKQEHLELEEYRIAKEIEAKQKQIENITNLPVGTCMVKKARLEQLEQTEKKYKEELPRIDEANKNLTAVTETMRAYMSKIEEFEKDKNRFDELVNAAANRKVENMKDKAIEFIKSLGLLEKYKMFCMNSVEKLAQNMGKIKS